MDKLRLGDRIEDQVPERGELHSHGVRVKDGTNRMLHPRVRDQDPQRREIGADRDQPSDREMTEFRQSVPTEEKQADKSRFEEEGH